MASVWGELGSLAVFLNWGNSVAGGGVPGTLPLLCLLGDNACVLLYFLIHPDCFQRPLLYIHGLLNWKNPGFRGKWVEEAVVCPWVQ